MSHTATHARPNSARQAPVKSLPTRQQPVWEHASPSLTATRDHFRKVISGRLPIGLLADELITEEERVAFVSQLRHCRNKQYDNFEVLEKAYVHGKPFVDAPTLHEYLTSERDELFDAITAPLFEKLVNVVKSFGFNVAPLIDEVTMLPYPAKVCREISIPEGCYTESGNSCTVLHCDDILRDGYPKPDFRTPGVLQGREYHQFSICLQLEDGGYRPDDVIVHEKQYSSELEPLFYGEGAWRFDANALKDCRACHHTPELRKAYLFSTLNFHDIRGGHPLSKRINFSVFFLYVPGTNTVYYYN